MTLSGTRMWHSRTDSYSINVTPFPSPGDGGRGTSPGSRSLLIFSSPREQTEARARPHRRQLLAGLWVVFGEKCFSVIRKNKEMII